MSGKYNFLTRWRLHLYGRILATIGLLILTTGLLLSLLSYIKTTGEDQEAPVPSGEKSNSKVLDKPDKSGWPEIEKVATDKPDRLLKWAIKQIDDKKNTVDFAKHPKGKHDKSFRVLSPAGLSKLLKAVDGRRSDIFIDNAIVSGTWGVQLYEFKSAFIFGTTTFRGAAEMVGCTFPKGLYFNGCKIGSHLMINQCNIKYNLELNQCTVKDKLEISSCTIDGYLKMTGIENDRVKTLKQVEIGDIDLNNTNVAESIQLGEVTSQVVKDKTVFNYKTLIVGGRVAMTHVKADGHIILVLKSRGPLFLDWIKAEEQFTAIGLVADRIRAQQLEAKEVDFSNTKIVSKYEAIGPLQRHEVMDISQSKCGSVLRLDGLQLSQLPPQIVKGAINLNGIEAKQLSLRNWQEHNTLGVPPISIFGGKYENVVASFNDRSKESIGVTPLDVNRSQNYRNVVTIFGRDVIYNSNTFAQLEKFLNEAGQHELADKVYVKRREEASRSQPWYRQPWEFLIKWLCNYGTNYSGFACAFLFLWGVSTALCYRNGHVHEKPGHKNLAFAAWAGFDLIFPLASLGSSSYYDVQLGKKSGYLALAIVLLGLGLAIILAAALPSTFQRR